MHFKALSEEVFLKSIKPVEYLPEDWYSIISPNRCDTNPNIAQRHWLDVIKKYVALNGAFAAADQEAYLDAWTSVDSDEGVPLAVAIRVFGEDPKAIIEELNKVLVA